MGIVPADQSAVIDASAPDPIGAGFRPYHRFDFERRHPDHAPQRYSRDVLRVGRVAIVLPVDPAAGVLVLIRQFRMGAHLASGRGDNIEAVGGLVDAGEPLLEAAYRETCEEIGVAPTRLIPMLSCNTAPAICDEEAHFFLGLVDSSRVPPRAGLASEAEQIDTIKVEIDVALKALAAGTIRNGPLIMALQWLALNRHRLDDMLAVDAA